MLTGCFEYIIKLLDTLINEANSRLVKQQDEINRIN
jgi:hypothetical protein